MADALAPLAELSKALQHRDMNIVYAHKLIKTKISFFRQRAEAPGNWYINYCQALSGTASIKVIRPTQFYRSLVDSLEARLITTVSRRGASAVDVEANATSYGIIAKQPPGLR